MIPISDTTFDETVVDDLALVDVWANWCGPCRMFRPILEQFAEETGVPVYSLDADENPETMRQFNIMSIPTVLVYKAGEHVDTLVGVRPYARLVKELEPYRAEGTQSTGHLRT